MAKQNRWCLPLSFTNPTMPSEAIQRSFYGGLPLSTSKSIFIPKCCRIASMKKKRILVDGDAYCGKTTLAGRLAEATGLVPRHIPISNQHDCAAVFNRIAQNERGYRSITFILGSSPWQQECALIDLHPQHLRSPRFRVVFEEVRTCGKVCCADRLVEGRGWYYDGGVCCCG